MIYEGGEFGSEQLFKELKEAAEREGVSNFVQYKDLIDELVEEKRIYGFFSDDEDLTQLKENLESRWPEVEKMTKEPGLPSE